MKKILFLHLIILLIPASLMHAFNITGGHRGGITALINYNETIISSGEDGYVVLWDTEQKAAYDRIQLTTYRIKTLVSSMEKEQICIVEEAGFDRHIVSAWSWQKQKLFSIHSDKPVTYINYSANGSYIIAAGINGSSFTLIDSQTGDIVLNSEILAGSIALAVTGRAERNMLLYLQNDHFHEGQILYMDLESGSILSSFDAPFLSNPIIFNNNSILAGISSDGLLLVDAASGAIIDIIENIEKDALLYPSNGGFYCSSRRNVILSYYSVNEYGKLTMQQELHLPSGSEHTVSFAFSDNIVFASDKGNLYLLEDQNAVVPFSFSFQTRITEIAANDTTIAFLTESGELGFLPIDYNLLEETEELVLEWKRGYTHITPVDSLGFILWQKANTQFTPQFINPNPNYEEFSLSFLSGRFPLRSVDSKDGKLLFVNSAGNISIYNFPEVSGTEFALTFAGTTDAAFINNEYIFLCRSTIGGNSPFLFVNFVTEETVPVFYYTQAALSVTPVKSGKLYAEAALQDKEGFKTTVVDLSPVFSGSRSASSTPVMIFEYMNEAEHLSIAESAGNLAIACGSEGAFLLAEEKVNFERTNALPVKLLGCEDFFISLDGDGNIAWHDNKSAKVLAVFSLYADQWLMQSDIKITGGLRN